MAFTGELYQTFREELTPIFLKLLKKKKKIAAGGTLSNSFYGATITLMPKPKISHKKENFRPISLMQKCRCKSPQQNISKPNPKTHQKIIYHDQMEFIPEMQGLFIIC